MNATKIKIFINIDKHAKVKSIQEIEKEINDFISNKELLDIKHSICEFSAEYVPSTHYYIVIYKESE